jgi:hypothetical protein
LQNKNSLHHLSRGEEGINLFIYLFNYLFGRAYGLFSTQKEDQTKSLTCRVKIITLFGFRTLMRIAPNKCGRN